MYTGTVVHITGVEWILWGDLMAVPRYKPSILTRGLHLLSPEQEERSREAIEQWRQWHYDGLYPSYLYNRHHI